MVIFFNHVNYNYDSNEVLNIFFCSPGKKYYLSGVTSGPGPETQDGVGGGPCPPPPNCIANIKKGSKGKKEKVSKQKLLKGCHQGENIIVLLILERLEFENFSFRATMVADNTSRYSITFHSPHPPRHFEIHFAGPD